MVITKKCLNVAVLGALVVIGLCLVGVNRAEAAATLYFDNNSTGSGYGTSNNGSYSWDGSVWAATAGGTFSTSAWVPGDLADSLAAPSVNGSYTVNVANDEQVAGVENGATGTNVSTMIISQKPSTTGDLNIGSAAIPFRIDTAGFGLEIKAPIVGSGGQVVQHGNGTLYLYGANTFSGGMEVTGGQSTYYNTSQSFGTGSITIDGGVGNAFLNGAAGQVTIPNNWVLTVITPLNLVGGTGSIASPGTIFSGNFPIPASSTQDFETSNIATTVDEISGVISGTTGSVEIQDVGTMIFAGPNTYKGTTTLSSALATGTPPVLVLGAPGTIASSSQLIMAGGVLNPDGLDQNMSANTTLALTVNSKIDFSVGGSEVDFKDSSGVAWTASTVLNLASWNFSTDMMRFGTTSGGLTSTQLAQIEFNGDGTTLGTAYLNDSGYLVPEPATISLLLGVPLMLGRRRRMR